MDDESYIMRGKDIVYPMVYAHYAGRSDKATG